MGDSHSTKKPTSTKDHPRKEAFLPDEEKYDFEIEAYEDGGTQDRLVSDGTFKYDDLDPDSAQNKPDVKYAEGDSDEEGLHNIVKIYKAGVLPDLQTSKHTLNDLNFPFEKLGVEEKDILDRGHGRERDYSLLESEVWHEERRKKQIFHDNARDKFFEEEGSIAFAFGFAICGYSLWTFPQLCIKYGSFAFCVMYFIVTCFLTAPAIYLEMILGQFGQTGPFHVWKITPIFIGLGAAMFANTFISVIINNTRMVWLAFYACESFREKFPWTSCDREWTTTDCKDFDILEDDLHLNEKSRSPAYEFFRARVLRVWKSDFADEVLPWHPFNTYPKRSKSHKIIPYPDATKSRNGKEQYSINNIGIPSLDLLILLAAIYFLAFLILRFRIRFIGAFNFTILFIGYTLLAIPFMNGWILPTPVLANFFNTEGFHNLIRGEAWVAVIKHSLIASGLGTGVYILIGSHRPYTNRDIKSSAFAAAFGSWITHCFVSLIMNMYWKIAQAYPNTKPFANSYFGNDPVIEVFPLIIAQGAQGHPELQFLKYYSFSFYCGLVCLSVVRTFCGIYFLKRTVMDSYKQLFDSFRIFFDPDERGDYRRWDRVRLILDDRKASNIMLTIFLLATYLATVVCLTRGGIYIQIFLENYCSATSFAYVFIIETIALTYLWGTRNIDNVVKNMTCYQTTLFYRLAWKYFTPATIFLYIIHRGIVPERVEFDGIKVPEICHYIGVMFSSIPLLIIGSLGAKGIIDSPVVFWRDKLALSLAPHYEWTIIASGKLGSNRTHWIHYMNFPSGFGQGPGFPRVPEEMYYTCKGCGQIIRSCWRTKCSLGILSNNLLCLRFSRPQHPPAIKSGPMELTSDIPNRKEMKEHIPNLKLKWIEEEDEEDRREREDELMVKKDRLPDGTEGDFKRGTVISIGQNQKETVSQKKAPMQMNSKQGSVQTAPPEIEFDYEKNAEEIRALLLKGEEEKAENLKEIRAKIFRQMHPNEPYKYDL